MMNSHIIWVKTPKIEEIQFLCSNQDIKYMKHFSYCLKSAFSVFDSGLYAWIPNNENFFSDSNDFLSKNPISFNSKQINLDLIDRKVLKIYSNNGIYYALSKDGHVYVWGNDREKKGILGLGFIYAQHKPVINPNFFDKKIIQLALSDKHCVALELNRQVFTWGTGKYGELGFGGKNDLSSSMPVPITFSKGTFVRKVGCGRYYTCFIDYDSTVSFIGKILPTTEDTYMNNLESRSFIQNTTYYLNNTNYVNPCIIEKIKSSEFQTGLNVLALLDRDNYIYLYTDEEGLHKVQSKRIKSFQFTQNDLYAISSDEQTLYEFSYPTYDRQDFSLFKYIETKYVISSEFRNIEMIELPYFNEALFFKINSNSKIAFDNLFSRKKKLFAYLEEDSVKENERRIQSPEPSSTSSVLPANSLYKRKQFNDSPKKEVQNNNRIKKISKLLGDIFEHKIENMRESNKFNIIGNSFNRAKSKKTISLEKVKFTIMNRECYSITPDRNCDLSCNINDNAMKISGNDIFSDIEDIKPRPKSHTKMKFTSSGRKCKNSFSMFMINVNAFEFISSVKRIKKSTHPRNSNIKCDKAEMKITLQSPKTWEQRIQEGHFILGVSNEEITLHKQNSNTRQENEIITPIFVHPKIKSTPDELLFEKDQFCLTSQLIPQFSNIRINKEINISFITKSQKPPQINKISLINSCDENNDSFNAIENKIDFSKTKIDLKKKLIENDISAVKEENQKSKFSINSFELLNTDSKGKFKASKISIDQQDFSIESYSKINLKYKKDKEIRVFPLETNLNTPLKANNLSIKRKNSNESDIKDNLDIKSEHSHPSSNTIIRHDTATNTNNNIIMQYKKEDSPIETNIEKVISHLKSNNEVIQGMTIDRKIIEQICQKSDIESKGNASFLMDCYVNKINSRDLGREIFDMIRFKENIYLKKIKESNGNFTEDDNNKLSLGDKIKACEEVLIEYSKIHKNLKGKIKTKIIKQIIEEYQGLINCDERMIGDIIEQECDSILTKRNINFSNVSDNNDCKESKVPHKSNNDFVQEQTNTDNCDLVSQHDKSKVDEKYINLSTFLICKTKLITKKEIRNKIILQDCNQYTDKQDNIDSTEQIIISPTINKAPVLYTHPNKKYSDKKLRSNPHKTSERSLSDLTNVTNHSQLIKLHELSPENKSIIKIDFILDQGTFNIPKSNFIHMRNVSDMIILSRRASKIDYEEKSNQISFVKDKGNFQTIEEEIDEANFKGEDISLKFSIHHKDTLPKQEKRENRRFYSQSINIDTNYLQSKSEKSNSTQEFKPEEVPVNQFKRKNRVPINRFKRLSVNEQALNKFKRHVDRVLNPIDSNTTKSSQIKDNKVYDPNINNDPQKETIIKQDDTMLIFDKEDLDISKYSKYDLFSYNNTSVIPLIRDSKDQISILDEIRMNSTPRENKTMSKFGGKPPEEMNFPLQVKNIHPKEIIIEKEKENDLIDETDDIMETRIRQVVDLNYTKTPKKGKKEDSYIINIDERKHLFKGEYLKESSEELKKSIFNEITPKLKSTDRKNSFKSFDKKSRPSIVDEKEKKLSSRNDSRKISEDILGLIPKHYCSKFNPDDDCPIEEGKNRFSTNSLKSYKDIHDNNNDKNCFLSLTSNFLKKINEFPSERTPSRSIPFKTYSSNKANKKNSIIKKVKEKMHLERSTQSEFPKNELNLTVQDKRALNSISFTSRSAIKENKTFHKDKDNQKEFRNYTKEEKKNRIISGIISKVKSSHQLETLTKEDLSPELSVRPVIKKYDTPSNNKAIQMTQNLNQKRISYSKSLKDRNITNIQSKYNRSNTYISNTTKKKNSTNCFTTYKKPDGENPQIKMRKYHSKKEISVLIRNSINPLWNLSKKEIKKELNFSIGHLFKVYKNFINKHPGLNLDLEDLIKSCKNPEEVRKRIDQEEERISKLNNPKLLEGQIKNEINEDYKLVSPDISNINYASSEEEQFDKANQYDNQDDLKSDIIKNLEKFKFDKVKEKLEDILLKEQLKGRISDNGFCNTPNEYQKFGNFEDLLCYGDEANIEFEPFELEHSKMISINFSQVDDVKPPEGLYHKPQDLDIEIQPKKKLDFSEALNSNNPVNHKVNKTSLLEILTKQSRSHKEKREQENFTNEKTRFIKKYFRK